MSTSTRIGSDPDADEQDAPDRSPAGPGGRVTRSAVVVGAIVIVLALVALWLVAFSSVLGVKTVSIVGTKSLSAVEVRTAADVRNGTPLIRLNRSAIARRVESIAGVASANVRTSYPSTVTITVVERTALGYLVSGHDYVLMDATGDQYESVTVKPKGLPLFDLPDGPSARATGQAVATVAASLSSALRRQVASVQAFDQTAITLLLVDGRVVRWGSAERSADKARILPVLLSQPGRQFDVTDPDQVFTH